jgi:hypothetical protein
VTEPVQRERLRFVEFDFETLPNGRARSRVVLEGPAGERFIGTAEGLGLKAGALRCAAQALTNALQQSAGEKLRFELLGVKAVRAFDSTVVIVSLSCHDGRPATRLVGSCLGSDDLNRCAALAVLNATNRLLGNRVFTR